MKIITKTTVQLTKAEQETSELFGLILDDGYNIPEAIDMLREQGHRISPAFEAWLSGTPLPR